MQSDQILASKLRAPARDGVIGRPRLFEILDRGLEGPLILVSASAGSGKSTLVASWLADRRIRFAWLALEAADNDRVRFARYLSAAMGCLLDTRADAPLTVAGDTDLEVLIAYLLAAVPPDEGDAVLVLDDYHLIDSAEVHAAVSFLITHLPSTVHVAITTRADPPLPLARLRANDALREIRADALRFSVDEAEELMIHISRAPLSRDDIAVLTAKAEGWVAGLKLAALSLQGRDDPSRFVSEFSGTHRFVLDYLVEEVLARQPDALQTFLVETSVLERLTGPLCDAVTGRSDGQAMLERLERANLFTIPLDDERRWFRYHHLFAELLRARLRQSRLRDEAALRLRASAWYEAHGLHEEAIGQALAANEVSRTLDLLEGSLPRYALTGEFDAFRRWLDALPPEAVRAHAPVNAFGAWDRIFRGDFAGAEAVIGELRESLRHPDGPGDPTRRRTVPAQIALLRASIALRRDADAARALALAAEARELIPADLPADLDAVLRGMHGLFVASGHLFGGALVPAANAYREAMPHLWAGGNTIGVAQATLYHARVEQRLGHVQRAADICREALERATQAGIAATPAFASVHLALAEILAARGDASGAAREVRLTLDLAGRMGDARVMREARALLDHLARASAGRHADLIEGLTGRELEVLRLLAAGRSNRQIADELVVALGTVKAHVHAISSKLGTESRLGSVARARSLGLLET